MFALLKAPSAVVTVGYLAAGLTLPFLAAYREKYCPSNEYSDSRKHTQGRVIDGRFGTHGSYCRIWPSSFGFETSWVWMFGMFISWRWGMHQGVKEFW